MSSMQEYFQQIQDDTCDCDRRCPKCGKLKAQPYPYSTYPSPGTVPSPTQPWYPWIVYTSEHTGGCK
jgi:hypothetical protein